MTIHIEIWKLQVLFQEGQEEGWSYENTSKCLPSVVPASRPLQDGVTPTAQLSTASCRG